MNKKYLLALPVLAAIVIGLLFVKKNKAVTIKPEHKSITEAVYASGFIVPKNEYKVYALSDGYIVGKFKNAGDEVKKGEAILQIQNDATAAKLSASSAAYDYAKLNASDNSPVLLDLKNKIRSAEARYRNDSLNYARFQNMFAANAVTKNQMDQATLQWEVSTNDYKSARELYQKTKDQLQVELRNAQSGLAASGQEAGNYTIRSLMDGMVYDLTKELGEAVRRNDLVGMVGETGSKLLELSVDQSDIARIKIGQKVVVKLDLTGDKVYQASITKIYPNMNQNDQSFKVEAEFTENYSFNFVHASVEANIIIAQKDNALIIPKNVLQPGDEVEVLSIGVNKKVKIKKGLENLEFVEVTEGISDSDEVVLPKEK